MQNKKTKKLLFFISVVFLISLVFFYFLPDRIKASSLEVKYPTSQSGFKPTSTDTPLPEFLKYIFDIGLFVGFASAFYSLSFAGVLYLMSPAKPELLSSAKDRVTGAISGVLILLMLYLIITTINPQLAILKSENLTEVPLPAETNPPGVYFYKSNDCSDAPQMYNSNVADFGINLSNQINSAKIISGPDQDYVSTMYENPGLFGKCQDIDPNANVCQRVENFSSSASIHTFDFNSSGDGVYIYRKPFFNTDGGWVKISGEQIGSRVFGKELKDLTFNGYFSECNVPEDEKICAKWNNRGECTQKDCPTLAGKEISSIKIEGNYIVFLIYADPKDADAGPWSYCQEFPTPNDINREGPKQIKWEKVLNQRKLPNWIYIYPVKTK